MSDKDIKDLLSQDINIDKELSEDKSVDTLASESTISNERISELVKDQELEDKYGSQNVRTLVESAASGASFGISDQALIKLGVTSKEALRERRNRNKEADIAGEIIGVAGSALLSGGSSTLAKGISAGAKGAIKSGQLVENLTAKGLKSLLKGTGKDKLASEVLRKTISKGAGSAVEGSLYGMGELVSEQALGNAKFNAENVVATVGAGALIGGIAGSAFGTMEMLVPVIKGDKVVNFVNKKMKNIADPVDSALLLGGFSPENIKKLKKINPKAAEHMPIMLQDIAEKKGLSTFVTNKKLQKGVVDYIEETGSNISSLINEVGVKLKGTNILPTKSKVASTIQRNLDDFKALSGFTDETGKVLPGKSSQVKKVDELIETFDSWLLDDKVMSPKEIQDLKIKYRKLANFDKLNTPKLDTLLDRSVAQSLSKELMELADLAGDQVGENLKRELINYSSASQFIENFGDKINTPKGSSFLDSRDMLLGFFASGGSVLGAAATAASRGLLKSDLKRKLNVLVNIEKSNQAVGNIINKSLNTFIKGTKAVSRTTKPVVIKTMLSSGFTRDENGNKPKTKDQAFENLQSNLTEMSNPETAEKFYNNYSMEGAPETDAYTKTILASAIHFLGQKLPVSFQNSSAINDLLKRKYKPSTIEMAKFERYLEVIEKPLSVLDELNKGTLTREHTEALKAVYPDIYTRIQTEVLTKIQNNPESIDYKKQLLLGNLLDIPTNAALQVDNLKALQSTYNEAQVSQAGGATQFSASKAQDLGLAESEATTTQKAEKR